MKKTFVIVLFVIVAVGIVMRSSRTSSQTISLSGAWALYPMAVAWSEEYRKLHPEIRINISAGGAGKGMADALSGVVEIGMVSRDIYPVEIQKGAWFIPVVKDAVVPVVNSNHPEIEILMKQGITRETFVEIWIAGQSDDWRVYTRSDACGAAETWAHYLGKKQEDLRGIGVFGDPGLADAVRKDVRGIGYNNINFVYNPRTGRPIDGIRVLPIDLNGNGVIDPEEDFYGTRDELTAAIAEGRYPSPPARDLYFVCGGKPENPVVVDFIRWVLTEGQQMVGVAGYIELDAEVIEDDLRKLDGD